MRRFILLLLVPSVLAGQARPRAGMVVTRSTRFAPGTYRINGRESLDSALITVRGDNIVLDFRGVTLEGIAPDGDPDQARGVAVLVDGGSHVTIRGATLRGYKVAILARGTRDLVLENDDVSYNWKPRLFSLVEHESLADWLSFHHNENREWLRFGAGIYLEGVHGGSITGTRAIQGMNGLLLVRSDSLRIKHDDFSFDSGLGIGLYRSSDNVIAYNTVDYDVRGYSHRFYHRGQDSAGILLYEQSCRNIIAFNSVTHGGDGLFLWAGQSTMDSGTGGANDNFVYDNDFSFAPANGIEATFSRNTFVWNRLTGNDYGVWGGYSYASVFLANIFEQNRTGIAIEHGQEDSIIGNQFNGDTTAINLWASPIEPSDWGYPKHHDTRSRDDDIGFNLFRHDRVAARIRQTTGAAWHDNTLVGVDTALARDTSTVTDHRNRMSDGSGDNMLLIPSRYSARADSIGGPGKRPEPRDARRPRSAIVVDEWGPYDWSSPKLFPVDSSHAVPLRLAVLGPRGNWRVTARQGIASVSGERGASGDTISVTPSDSSDWDLTLEMRSPDTMRTSRGRHIAPNTPWRLSYRHFEPRMDWDVRFYPLADTARLMTPLATGHESRLDYMWYRPTVPNVPQERFATLATTSVTLSPGSYSIRTISDDAIRVWVDGALVIDDWTPHESKVDHARLAGGTHAIRVLHYQVDGWTELRVEIVRGVETSAGSPGPH